MTKRTHIHLVAFPYNEIEFLQGCLSKKDQIQDGAMVERRKMQDSALYLTNTLTRKKERFRSREPGKVKMFTCGPSTYGNAHIGNYRTFIFEDVLQRYLEYLDFEVERVIPFTDVEDKAIVEAQKQKKRLRELTGPVEERFLKEARQLAIKLPPHIPRSSKTVDQAVRLIRILLDKGYAYRHGKDIFFDPLKCKDFGRLYGLDMSRWPKKKRRFRKDTYPGQRWNLGDFILWHGSTKKDMFWDTEIGQGRPSWNIQDPAAITRYLGYAIDIACGGVDNLIRHHDYNLAIMEAISGESFCKFWVHGGHVVADGAKMSKSKGNIVYLTDLLAQGYPAGYVRFFLMDTHYRKKLNLRKEALQKSAGKLLTLREMVGNLTEKDLKVGPSSLQAEELVMGIEKKFLERMNDDLDVRGAFREIREHLVQLMALKGRGEISRKDVEGLSRRLLKIDGVFQVFHLS